MNFTLRKPEDEKFYQEQKALQDPNFCFACAKDLIRKEFIYWFICENRYSYTGLMGKHDLLVVKRHVRSIEELTRKEILEWTSIFYQLNNTHPGKYHQMTYNFPERQSCKFHFHLHLTVFLPSARG
jgi:hypothetical protein